MTVLTLDDLAIQQTKTDECHPALEGSTGAKMTSPESRTKAVIGAVGVGLIAALSPHTVSPPAAFADARATALFCVDPNGFEESIAEQLQTISKQYESTMFSYPATVLGLEDNASGEPEVALVRVSINGDDMIVKRPITQFPFRVIANMHLIVDGIQRKNGKQLVFRKAPEAQWNAEQESLLQEIVSAFDSSRDA